MFLYVESMGCYTRMVYDKFKVVLASLLSHLLRGNYSRNALDGIWKELEFGGISCLGYPTIDNNHVVFGNGVLNLDTKHFQKFTPIIFTTHRLTFGYDRDFKNIPAFLKFLDDFYSGYEDRKTYLPSILQTILLSTTDFQIIVYIWGPGGTGKSMLPTLLIALLGDQSRISMTLSALSNDQFEVSNLGGKKIVLINDTNGIMKDPSVLKAYSDGDLLRDRKHPVQGNQGAPRARK